MRPWIHSQRGLRKLGIKVLIQYPWRYCVRHADAIASEGVFQDDQLISIFGIDRERIFELPVAIDIPYIEGKLKDRKLTRGRCKLSEKNFVLISVNAFHPDKGIDYLVDAFKIVREYIQDTKLILAGSTGTPRLKNGYNKIAQKITDYNLTESIILYPDLPEEELYDYYSLADLYVSPTFDDDFIMSIAEAMVAGLPIVSTGQRFLVKEGLNGYIVPKGNPQAMAQAVMRVYEERDRWRAMGKESQKIVKPYDWSRVVRLAIRKYEDLLGK